MVVSRHKVNRCQRKILKDWSRIKNYVEAHPVKEVAKNMFRIGIKRVAEDNSTKDSKAQRRPSASSRNVVLFGFL